MASPAPYHRGDRRVTVSARITLEQLQRLDDAARELGVSRSAFIAMKIDRPSAALFSALKPRSSTIRIVR